MSLSLLPPSLVGFGSYLICSIHGAGMDPSPSNSVERCRRKCLLEQAFFSEVKLERRMRLGGLCFSKD
ncbi:hypothetical protein RchiOBHm_Chr3g0457941 [Rosa chinensis]|uniref:Uncharacterized protein n=1 Tax=Rosa chinensis TaxID=74649 RepID=A0A2P6R7Q5_ROSCH|nr:hypothetical protein RchiOBHm_Chr3g0457941 [Rosa chinensis]